MKRKILALVTALTLVAGLTTGCGKKKEEKVIKIGATPTPHAEILEVVKDDLEKEGYKLEIVEYNDYVLPNTAVEEIGRASCRERV